MPYQITHFTGTPLATVDDGTVDQTTDLKLIGKNYAGYGTIQNDNFVYLLENFASPLSPPKAVPGQVWYDSANNKLKFYDKNLNWRTTGGTTTSLAGSVPTGLTLGDLWYTTDNKQLYVINSDNTQTLIGPQSVTGAGQAGLETVQVVGQDTFTHTIILGFVNAVVSFIMSSDAFTLNDAVNPIDGFSVISQGITLRDSSTGHTSSNYRFWGTASDSDRLANKDASNYLLKDNATFTGTAHFPDVGLTVGTTTNDFSITVDTANNSRLPTLQNTVSSGMTFKVKDATNNTITRNPLVISSINVNPGADLVYDFGSSVLRWNNVWAGTLHASDLYGTLHGALTGTADKSNTLLYNSLYVSATDAATANTIMARDAAANTAVNQLTATTIVATTVGGPTTTLYGTLSGKATNANNLLYDYNNLGTNFVAATAANVNNSIVARDTSGNFACNIMTGTATKAKYADLAEKYLADNLYDPGTVVVFGGEHEITVSEIVSDHRVAGVISSHPAFLMNEESEGLPVALRGKVPVKVVGKVSKGDLLVTSGVPGYAMASTSASASCVIGKSIENKADDDQGIVMAVIV